MATLPQPALTRRALLAGAALAAAGAAAPAWAKWPRLPTPPGFEGPFYPPDWPRVPADLAALDDDADLLWVRGQAEYAEGVVLDLEGRILDPSGNALPNVEVDIWQVDNNGRYRHPRDPNPAPIEPGFQGFGRAVTDGNGHYRFRTIRPVPYPGRTPHIHFKLKDSCDPNLLTTQMYLAGEERNADDLLYRAIPEAQRRFVTVVLRRSRPVRLQGRRRRVERAWFDLVLGTTPCIG